MAEATGSADHHAFTPEVIAELEQLAAERWNVMTLWEKLHFADGDCGQFRDVWWKPWAWLRWPLVVNLWRELRRR